jgi:DNA-binding response OmpR family regulator
MDAGRMSIQVRPLEVVGLTRSLVMSFQSLAESKKIHLIFDPEADEIVAYTDRDKFEKILTNLLSNAFKFTGDTGEIIVVLRILDGDLGHPGGHQRRLELVVSDTGVGIEGPHLERIFDRFYQGASSLDQGGTGIGLALTRELVEILRGDITVQSAPGHGTTFAVRLPIGRQAWRPEEIAAEEPVTDTPPLVTSAELLSPVQQPDTATSPAGPGKPVVLIVEDNPDVRLYVRGFLEKQYVVMEAEHGQAGLTMTRESAIDLVISDIMMPVMDGVHLCKELKADERTNHIPVILLTARATSEAKIQGLDVGADDYVVKPFEPRELEARVKNLIENRRKLREKYHRQVTLGPENIPVTSADERFLKKFKECVEAHLTDAGYHTEALAHDMCMSRMQLNRKLHALTGQPTHHVVRELRLQRSAALLRGGVDNVAGVAFEVGFNNLSHFARAFRERFGVVPSEYARQEHILNDRGSNG